MVGVYFVFQSGYRTANKIEENKKNPPKHMFPDLMSRVMKFSRSITELEKRGSMRLTMRWGWILLVETLSVHNDNVDICTYMYLDIVRYRVRHEDLTNVITFVLHNIIDFSF